MYSVFVTVICFQLFLTCYTRQLQPCSQENTTTPVVPATFSSSFTAYVTSGQLHSVGDWERSVSRQSFIYNVTYDNGTTTLTLARYDDPIHMIYFITINNNGTRCRTTPVPDSARISSFAWLADAQCMEYNDSETGEVIEVYSNPESMNTESMEFKRNKRHEPFRYTFVRGISITFEFESFTPTEPSPAAFEIPAACTTSSGSVPQQMLSFLLVAVCMAYFSAYI